MSLAKIIQIKNKYKINGIKVIQDVTGTKRAELTTIDGKTIYLTREDKLRTHDFKMSFKTLSMMIKKAIDLDLYVYIYKSDEYDIVFTEEVYKDYGKYIDVYNSLLEKRLLKVNNDKVYVDHIEILKSLDNSLYVKVEEIYKNTADKNTFSDIYIMAKRYMNGLILDSAAVTTY